MKTIAVIDGAFGDCGKGRTVDDLLIGVDPARALVVRHNSSAQAGHTVDHGDRRHVFSHFGSGTLRGVPTHLGPRFVVNPDVFVRELDDLRLMLAGDTSMSCSPICLVTTPYDTAANQILEVTRGTARHGSCGIGFGQTIHRDILQPALSIRVGNLDAINLQEHLEAIAAFYRRELGDAVNIDHPAAAFLRDMRPNLSPWLDALACFRARVEITAIGRAPETLIFEGAQGLMLDQAHPVYFPHVTRCSTGLADVIPLARTMGRRDIEVMYVLRPYLTRHGAGPLPAEISTPPAPKFEDRTNQPNDWQGTLRFGLLDPDEVITTIRRDITAARRAGAMIQPALTMTCIDQLEPDGMIPIVRKRVIESAHAISLAAEIATAIGARQLDVTYSPLPGARQSIPLCATPEQEEAYG